MPTCIAPQFRNLKTSRVSKPIGGSRRFCLSGCVPEGSHRLHEARVLYQGGRSRAGPREVAARRAGVLSVIRGYRSIGHAGPFAPEWEASPPYRRPKATDWPFAHQAYRAPAREARRDGSRVTRRLSAPPRAGRPSPPGSPPPYFRAAVGLSRPRGLRSAGAHSAALRSCSRTGA